jgi:hypothetical protein
MTQHSDSIKPQLHAQNLFNIYNLDKKDKSHNFLEPQFLHYKITIPSPYVYVWKHGVDIEVLNTHAVPSKSAWRHSTSSANKENLIYYYIPSNRHTNYLISLKREFTIMLELPFMIDYSNEMVNNETYQLFKEFERQVSIESEVNTTEIIIDNGEYENPYGRIKRFAQMTISNAWQAWSVQASAVRDAVANSSRRLNIPFHVTMTIVDVQNVKTFLDNIDIQDGIDSMLYDSLATCINDMVAKHKPIPVPYDASEVFVVGAVSDIQQQLSEYIQTRTRAYGVTSIVQLHVESEHAEAVKKEIRDHLKQFGDQIRDIVDYWKNIQDTKSQWVYDESGKVDSREDEKRVAIMQLYMDHLRLMIENGHTPLPLSTFTAAVDIRSNTRPLLTAETMQDMREHEGVDSEPL